MLPPTPTDMDPARAPADSAAGELGALAAPIDALQADTPARQAYEAFSSHASLYALAVVDGGGHPVGLLNRFKFLEELSRPFGRDLLMNRTVSVAMDASPLVVDEQMPLEQLSELLVDDGSKYIFDGFIVTREGRYLGIGTGYSLMQRLTERRQAALFHLAHHDVLTGLPNRQLFDDRLTQAMAGAERSGGRLALLYLDVDRFKAVNDGLGHAAGDQVLTAIADRLRGIVRAQDTVARLSGDEFAVVLCDIVEGRNAERVAGKLLQALREPYLIESREVNVSCSIGIALYPDDAASQAVLIRAADDAASHAKHFRNTWQRYSTELQRSGDDAVFGFSAVRHAIEGGYLDVHYQPVLEAGSLRVHGVEALVRWRDPQGALLPTTDLIRLAEDAGLIAAITDHVLGVALPQVLAWEREGLAKGLHLAVNISGVQIRDRALIPMLRRHLEKASFPATSLELEITESTVMRPGSEAAGVLNTLQEMGVSLSVDDFGTGYSSLSRLQRLPVSGLKIDRSFIQGIGHVEDAGALAQAIIGMAHSLRLVVTAEGVETEAQRTFLEAHGCDRLQGFLLGRPMCSADLVEFLKDHQQRLGA